MKNLAVWFEIPVTDMERAKRYSEGNRVGLHSMT